MSKNNIREELENTLRNSGVDFHNWKSRRWFLPLDGYADKTLMVFLSLDEGGFDLIEAPSNGRILQGAYLNVHTGENPDERPRIFERRKKDAKLEALKVLHWKGALSSKDLAQYARKVL